MASSFADLLHRQSLQLIPRQLSVNESDDKNVGSAIGNTSISAFVSTLIFNLVIFGLLVTLFIILRRTNRRIYAPRTYVCSSRHPAFAVF